MSICSTKYWLLQYDTYYLVIELSTLKASTSLIGSARKVRYASTLLLDARTMLIRVYNSLTHIAVYRRSKLPKKEGYCKNDSSL